MHICILGQWCSDFYMPRSHHKRTLGVWNCSAFFLAEKVILVFSKFALPLCFCHVWCILTFIEEEEKAIFPSEFWPKSCLHMKKVPDTRTIHNRLYSFDNFKPSWTNFSIEVSSFVPPRRVVEEKCLVVYISPNHGAWSTIFVCVILPCFVKVTSATKETKPALGISLKYVHKYVIARCASN